MAKKQKCPEFENHERWLVAFADMMTLLFALFVVLYSIANVEMSKLKKVSSSIQKAFGMKDVESTEEGGLLKNDTRNDRKDRVRGNTRRNAILTRNYGEIARLIGTDTKSLDQKIKERMTSSGIAKSDQNQIVVTQDVDGVRVTLLARQFFKPNEALLLPEAQDALDAVAASVKDLGRMVRIEGHTDNLPFRKNGLTNWELSTSRASAVVRYFIDKHQFHPQSIYASGFAETRPIVDNTTPENRSMNRRVDLKILYDAAVSDLSDTKDE